MYIRVNSTPNSPRRSIQIVEGYRDKQGKVKQRIVSYCGVATDEAEEVKLKAFAEERIIKIKLQREADAKQQSLFGLNESEVRAGLKQGRPKAKVLKDILPPSEVALDDVQEKLRLVEGVHEVGGYVFDDLYGNLLGARKLGKKEYERLRDVVLARLVMPASKLKIQATLVERFDKAHELQSLYRMMDAVYEQIPRMKQLTFNKTQRLFPGGVDLVLFDVTTLYFESIETDELRKFGYSKDHRFNTTQVVLALATNQDGLPVGYELFEGNKAEVSTLSAAIESWKKLFNIGRVCFIGDRAMMSRDNLALLEKMEYQYIVAAKLKQLPEVLQAKIFDEGHYQPTLLNNSLSWIGEFEHEGKRLVVSYKAARALKDQQEREQILKKLQKQLDKRGNAKTKKLISNRAVKQYMAMDEGKAILDEDKILSAQEWDGLHGVITNIKEDDAKSLIARYARLWKIEESFRINKHNLEMRPIFHYKPERIHAHIAICFMSFSVLRHLEYQVNLMQKVTVPKILEALLGVQASIHEHKRTKDCYRLPGYFSNDARKIYKAFNLERKLDAEVYLR